MVCAEGNRSSLLIILDRAGHGKFHQSGSPWSKNQPEVVRGAKVEYDKHVWFVNSGQTAKRFPKGVRWAAGAARLARGASGYYSTLVQDTGP
jgi:hypothetical protein